VIREDGLEAKENENQSKKARGNKISKTESYKYVYRLEVV
jgi:hypothetical protein